MQPIPNKFDGRADQRDYRFSLVKRQNNVCLFEKTYKSGGPVKFYEVVRLLPVPEKTFPSGKTYPAHEAMPNPSQWGEAGWTPTDLADAHTVFNRWVEEDSRLVPA